MTSRITSAYQQFSQQIRRTGDTTRSGQVQHGSKTNEQSPAGKTGDATRSSLTREQRQQVRELKESGTLENLSTILSQDEEVLLGKLFGGNYRSYDASAGPKRQLHQNVSPRGGIIDTKL